MTKPDASLHDPDPAYLRSLIDRADLMQREVAERIGVSLRQLGAHLSTGKLTHSDAPYPVQYAIEQLVSVDTAEDELRRQYVSALKLIGFLIHQAGGKLTLKQSTFVNYCPHPRATIEQHVDLSSGDVLFTLHEP